MKKLAIITALIGLYSVAIAVDTGVFNIKVKIVEEQVGIQIVESELDFGYVVKGTSRTSGGASVAVKNIGAVNVDYKLRLESNSFGWSTGTVLSDTDTDKYVLAAVFHTWDGLIRSTDAFKCFGDEDVLTTTDKLAVPYNFSPSTFSSAGVADLAEPTPEYADGYDVPPDQQVNIHFFFNAPTALSDTNKYGQENTIIVRITAVQH